MENENKYEDLVDRTLRLYALEIAEAQEILRKENPNFGKYIRKEEESGKVSFTLSFIDKKLLEERVRELTGDQNVKLTRTAEEFRKKIERNEEFIKKYRNKSEGGRQ